MQTARIFGGHHLKQLHRLILSLTVAAAATIASAQTTPAPVINTISPTTGSAGTVVTIVGQNLGVPPNFACFAPCPARVTFGTTSVAASNETNTSVTVVAPAHAAGTVDLTLTTGDGRSVTAAHAFTYVGQIESAWEKVLLPTYLEAPVSGSNGSLWKSDLWIRNNSDQGGQLAVWPCPGDACPAVFPSQRGIQAGETVHNITPFFRLPKRTPGRLIYLSKNIADRTSLQLRIADTSLDAQTAGTEIPVVRSRDFATAAIDLQNVPYDARFRQLLRIYDVDRASGTYRVRIYDEAEGVNAALLAEGTFTATTPEASDEFRSDPAYVEVDLRTLINSSLPSIVPSALRVVVEPVGSARFWAFVSVTNNTTQQVTTITPQ